MSLAPLRVNRKLDVTERLRKHNKSRVCLEVGGRWDWFPDSFIPVADGEVTGRGVLFEIDRPNGIPGDSLGRFALQIAVCVCPERVSALGQFKARSGNLMKRSVPLRPPVRLASMR